MHVVLLVNPRSGRGRGGLIADEVERLLREGGHTCVRMSLAGLARGSGAGNTPRAEETLRSSDALVAVGGDGTVRTAATLAAREGVPLAIAPAGTENLAAQEFGFAGRLQHLAGGLTHGWTRPVDLGFVSGWETEGEPRPGEEAIAEAPFLVMASVGFDADLVRAVHLGRTGPITRWTYAGKVLRLAAGWRAPRMQVQVDGQALFAGTGQLVVANAPRYACNLQVARGADPGDGRLLVVVLPGEGVIATAGWMLRLRRPGWEGAGAIRASGGEVWVKCVCPVHLQADGEWLEGGPVRLARFTLCPGVVRMVDLRQAEE